ncbi:MAG TPA: DUF2959 family protein, partial [Planctomycetota bacterium]|nr:DUF2959 family protein [Planctomycetota bacterium]
MRAYGMALALLLATGCKSSGDASTPVASTSASIQDIRDAVTNTKTGVDTAVSALTALTETNEGGLKKSYDRYGSALAGLKASALEARDHLIQLKLRRDAYLSKSLELSKDVKSPELRAGAEKRRTAVMDAFMTLNGKAQEARNAFAPIYGSLEDCRRFMESDFTMSSAAALKGE